MSNPPRTVDEWYHQILAFRPAGPTAWIEAYCPLCEYTVEAARDVSPEVAAIQARGKVLAHIRSLHADVVADSSHS